MAAKSDQSQSITDNASEQQSDNDRIVAFHTRVEGFLEKHTEIYDKLVHDFDEKEYERRILADNADKPPLEIITGSDWFINSCAVSILVSFIIFTARKILRP